MEYHANPTYEMKSLYMRYWRYMGARLLRSVGNYDPYAPAYSEYKQRKNEYIYLHAVTENLRSYR